MGNRIAVIGATGFIGSRLLQVFKEQGIQATSASPSAELKFDITSAEDFHKLVDFSTVINCSNTLQCPPIKFAEFCLKNRISFLETAAHTETIRSLLALKIPRPKGSVIAGVGLFPGLSNLLAASILTKSSQTAEIAVELSPLAGAGGAMVQLMTELLRAPSIFYEAGQAVTDPAVSRGRPFKFFKGRLRQTIKVGLPEAIMLPYSSAVSATATYLATRPGLFAMVFKILSRPALRWLGPFNRLALLLLRRILLSNRELRVCISATADDKMRQFEIDLGLRGTAVAIAATAQSLPQKIKPGVYCIDQLITLDRLVQTMMRIDQSLNLKII